MHHFRHRATRWNADTRSRLRTPRISGEEATASERREMEDFAVWALNRTLRGIFPLGAYQDMGFDDARGIYSRSNATPMGGDPA
jgi:hypothetical protein